MKGETLSYPKSSGLPEIVSSLIEREGLGLSKEQVGHYRRVVAIQLELLTDTTYQSALTPEQWRAVKDVFMLGPEISELRGFNSDLSNMTEPWQAALHEALELYGDPDNSRVD